MHRALTVSSVSPLQNDVKTLKKWMADVDVFLNEEWPALGDSEALEKQLEQCTVRKPGLSFGLSTSSDCFH